MQGAGVLRQWGSAGGVGIYAVNEFVEVEAEEKAEVGVEKLPMPLACNVPCFMKFV
jgi:hypothetical protein